MIIGICNTHSSYLCFFCLFLYHIFITYAPRLFAYTIPCFSLCLCFIITVCVCMHRIFIPLFPPSSPPACWLRISPMFSCDKTLNPNKTKGLNVSGSCPPAALHYWLSLSRFRSVSPITTRSFLSPNNYFTPPSQTVPFILNFQILSITAPCAYLGSSTHKATCAPCV